MSKKVAKTWAIGIDLGTANTRVAVFRNEKVEIIPDADGNLLMPSYVSFNERGRLIGYPAKSQAAFNSRNTVFSAKRLLSSRFDDAHVQTIIKQLPYRVKESGGQPVVEVDYMDKLTTFTIVEVLSMILCKAKENSERYLGDPVTDAVIGVPASFTNYHRNAIMDAASIAGLNVSHLMVGPCAVALFYSQIYARGKPEHNVVVFDLGAGTVSATSAVIKDGLVGTRAIASESYLGSENFVDRLVTSRLREVKKAWKKDISSNSRALRRLRTGCEQAIRDLSSAKEACISIDSLLKGRDFNSSITRTDFNDLCKDLFESALSPINRVLDDAKIEAKIKKSQIKQVLLVGGSSRIPMIQQLLSSLFDGKVLSRAINPDEGEVSGLAIAATMVKGGQDKPSIPYLLVGEVIPASIGVESTGGAMATLLSRNSQVPACAGGKLRIRPNTKSISIYEGERKRTKNNKLLAEISLATLNLPESREEVEIQYEIKVDWCKLRSSCTVKGKRGNSITMALDSLGHLPHDEIERLKADAKRYKMTDDAENHRVSMRDDLDARISSLDEALGQLTKSPVVEGLSKSLGAIREWTEQNPHAKVAEYSDKVQKLKDIESAMTLAERNAARDALGTQLEQTLQRVLSCTIPKRTSLLSEIGRIAVWFEKNVDAEPPACSQHRRRLDQILAQLPAEKPEDDKSEATLKPDKGSKQETDETQAAAEDTSSDEAMHSRNASPGVETHSLEGILFSDKAAKREPFTDFQFERISAFLRVGDKLEWSKTPRLYTVLRLIDQLDAIDAFINQNVTDIWFPFSHETLPSSISPSVQARFLDAQSVVLSKGFNLEKGGDRQHAHFLRSESLPFTVVAKLGRGAHGFVDKIISNISHDVANQSQIGSYSDPKHFALIMEPVGDYDLLQYYDQAKDNADMLSIMRSFPGCLANAAQYLHSSRIRHRDIKPSNIIIKGDRPLIADFGIAYSWENLTRGTTTADSMKSMVYAAPEVVRIDARNESADIWSLGCVFLEMATVLKRETIHAMRNHFSNQSHSHQFHANSKGIASWISQLRGTPTGTDDVVLDWASKMLQSTPSQRPTAAELFDDISAQSVQCGVLFCGPCCQDGVESTTDEEGETEG
ncbi:heat shock protein 70 [Fusarium austroafricanum]|uniref:non-chaperonin molecular chaperone ATPase n=1 Tax=Fusarium austroafricanum TaxID=2364996 RepID=A0A8H4KEP1_9HYPO|nr:heat shock protein 70 [Fusarium austroafricanum]